MTETPALKPCPSAEQFAQASELGRYLYAESMVTHTQTTRWDRLPPRARAYWTALAADRLMRGDAK